MNISNCKNFVVLIICCRKYFKCLIFVLCLAYENILAPKISQTTVLSPFHAWHWSLHNIFNILQLAGAHSVRILFHHQTPSASGTRIRDLASLTASYMHAQYNSVRFYKSHQHWTNESFISTTHLDHYLCGERTRPVFNDPVLPYLRSKRSHPRYVGGIIWNAFLRWVPHRTTHGHVNFFRDMSCVTSHSRPSSRFFVCNIKSWERGPGDKAMFVK